MSDPNRHADVEEELRAAVRRDLTPEEKEAQAVSFAYGTAGKKSGLSRDEVREVLERSG